MSDKLTPQANADAAAKATEVAVASSLSDQPVVPVGKPGIGILIVTLGTISITMGMILALIFREIPAGNRDLFNIALGSALTWTGSIIGYFVGSSQGSAAKDVTLSRVTTALTRP